MSIKNSSFAVFVMVYGRPSKMWTIQTLRNAGYTGKIYLVGDNTDSRIDDYRKIYRDDLIVFDKVEASKKYDAGDNSGDLRSTMYAANEIFEIAKNLGLEHFCIMCDDYISFEYRYVSKCGKKLNVHKVTDLDKVLSCYLDFLDATGFSSIAFAQGGDFIGGVENRYATRKPLIRKCMNSFLCKTDRRFNFMGRMNEDVTTYVTLGSRGVLFGTIPMISLVQRTTQSHKGGLTEMYIDNGTYVKSFFSVMYSPSCVRVSMLNTSNPRIHHVIKWANAVPLIVSESHRKPDSQEQDSTSL